MASPLQLEAGKLPPVPRAGFAAGDEGGRGARAARYVHTPGTSSQALGWIGTSEHGRQIEREKTRTNLKSRTVNSLDACGRHKEARAIAECGLHYRIYAKRTLEHRLRPVFCGHLLCPDCAHRRARPLIKKLSKVVNRPGRHYWHLLLSVPNLESISKLDVLELKDHFSELWNDWVFQDVQDENGDAFKITGAVRSIECPRSKDGKGWHPHIHVIFEVPRRLPWWWLILVKAAWNRINGGVCYLNLERAYSITKRGKKRHGRLDRKALREVCKYVTKSAEFVGNSGLVDELLRAFKGVRRVQCCGSFHGEQAEPVCREPGEDESGVDCGESDFRSQGFVPMPFTVPECDTFLLDSGERQLSFPWRERVRSYFAGESPPFRLEVDDVPVRGQKRIEFAGVMPEKSEPQPSLFADAA